VKAGEVCVPTKPGEYGRNRSSRSPALKNCISTVFSMVLGKKQQLPSSHSCI